MAAANKNQDFVVNIKLSCDHSMEMHIDPDWNVQQLKEAIHKEKQTNLPSDEMSVLFQGHALENTESLMKLDLGNFSYLHVVKSKKPKVQRKSESEIPDASLPIEAYQLSNYFVYCKTKCLRVCPAKLRVRCASCHQGTFVVHQGPNKWSDVLEKEQIGGECQTESCNGQYAEFYFKCTGHQTGEHEGSVPLPLIQRNSSEVDCLGCGDVMTEVLVFPCEMGHCICLECFKEFGNIALGHRDFVNTPDYGFTIGCPNKCSSSYLDDAHYFRILGDASYERYQRLATELCLMQNGGVMCPSPGCENAFIPDVDVQDVRCDHCNTLFCRLCQTPPHRGECSSESAGLASQSFALDPLRSERARWDKAALEKVLEISKPCPQCKSPTEKSEGCNHMICTAVDPRTGQKCGFPWCWVCVKEWTRVCQGTHWFPNS